jgi:hypothetical protein
MVADKNLDNEQVLSNELKGNISIISLHHDKIEELRQTKCLKLTYNESNSVHIITMKPGVVYRLVNEILDLGEHESVVVWCPVMNSGQPRDVPDALDNDSEVL